MSADEGDDWRLTMTFDGDEFQLDDEEKREFLRRIDDRDVEKPAPRVAEEIVRDMKSAEKPADGGE